MYWVGGTLLVIVRKAGFPSQLSLPFELWAMRFDLPGLLPSAK